MATLSSLNQYFINGVMTGFVNSVFPITAFSYAVDQEGAVLNDHVRVPFAMTPGTSSATFAYSSGYTGNNGQIVGKDVTLSSLLYEPLQLTDAEITILQPAVIERQGNLLGRQLGADFLSASLVNVTTTNFPTQATYSGSQFTSSNAMADLDYQANTKKWPDGSDMRNLVCNTTLWKNVLTNTNVNLAYAFGGIDPVQKGQIPELFGFKPWKTTVALQTGIGGFAANPNALVIAMAYHKPAPQASSILVSQEKLTDEKTGIVLGYREWYDASHATVNRIFDVLGGSIVGDPNALVTIQP